MIQQLCGAVFAAVAVAAGYPHHLTGEKRLITECICVVETDVVLEITLGKQR